MQMGPMTTQPSAPLFCKGSERVSSEDSAEDWQREKDGRKLWDLRRSHRIYPEKARTERQRSYRRVKRTNLE